MSTATIVNKQYNPAVKIYVATIAGPKSYESGGFTVENLPFTPKYALVNAGDGYIAEPVIANGVLKIKVYSSQGTEVSAETDLSAVNFTVLVIG